MWGALQMGALRVSKVLRAGPGSVRFQTVSTANVPPPWTAHAATDTVNKCFFWTIPKHQKKSKKN